MKKIFLLPILLLTAVILFAQQGERLMELPADQKPSGGQSLYIFFISLRSGKSVVISIDDKKIGHFFDGERAQIAVPNGKHVIRAYQMAWDSKYNMWKDDGDDRLTDTLKDESYTINVSNGPSLRYGPKARLVTASGPADLSSAQPAKQPSAQPAKQPPAAANTRVTSNTGIEGAVARASVVFVGELPQRSTLAVISIASVNTELALFAIDELEYQLVIAKQFTIVDRKTLDTIRSEQRFQVSGEVSDQSAVSIGNLLGANIVITGSITSLGNSQRLTLKALDVKTAQIITMAREQF